MDSLETFFDWTLFFLWLDYKISPIATMDSLETFFDMTLSFDWTIETMDSPGTSFVWTLSLLSLDFWDLRLLRQWILWRLSLTGPSLSFDWTIEIFTYWSKGFFGDLRWLDSLSPFNWTIETMDSLETSFVWTLSLLSLESTGLLRFHQLRQWVLWRPSLTGLLRSSPIRTIDSLETSFAWTLSLLWLD